MSQKLTDMEIKSIGNNPCDEFPKVYELWLKEQHEKLTEKINKTASPFYVTNPIHGGKVTCEKCGGFIEEGNSEWIHDEWKVKRYFHRTCFNRYEHYYGFNRPID